MTWTARFSLLQALPLLATVCCGARAEESSVIASDGRGVHESAEDEDAAAALRTQRADYFVPVDAELAPFATYPVKRVSFARDEGSVRIKYGFPRWLGGVRQPVELRGSYVPGAPGFDVTITDLGTGHCTHEGARFECRELLPGISIDLEQAESIMREDGLPEREIEGRLRVSSEFAADPIGIVSFDLIEP
jgi:hypothetical protein